MVKIRQRLKYFILAAIKAYQQFISPWLGGNCRFYPSCSRYAQQAIELHGILAGIKFTLQRIGRCHPGHPGGIDEVPGKRRSI